MMQNLALNQRGSVLIHCWHVDTIHMSESTRKKKTELLNKRGLEQRGD